MVRRPHRHAGGLLSRILAVLAGVLLVSAAGAASPQPTHSDVPGSDMHGASSGMVAAQDVGGGKLRARLVRVSEEEPGEVGLERPDLDRVDLALGLLALLAASGGLWLAARGRRIFRPI